MDDVASPRLGPGIAAGFAATIVLSAIMVAKQAMNVMPELDPIQMISGMFESPRAVGWLVHFAIGTLLWGMLFAWLAPHLPGPMWLRGVIFGAGAWLVMMVVMMPMAGAGLFGLKMGAMAPVATLMLHGIFGAVLGAVYGKLAAA